MNPDKRSAQRVEAAAAARMAPPPLVLTGERIRVGIVEDDESSCAMMAMVMRLSGLDVTEFHDCNSALVAARSETLDAYIVDWQVGPATSDRLVRELCGYREGRKPLIIMLSGHIHDDGRTDVAELGALIGEMNLEFRAKPYAPRKLAQEVSAIVRERMESGQMLAARQPMSA